MLEMVRGVGGCLLFLGFGGGIAVVVGGSG